MIDLLTVLYFLSGSLTKPNCICVEQEFNNDSVLQQLGLPAGEQVLGLCHRTFPFYWHDKLEEDHVMRLQQSLSLEQPSVDSVALELQTFSIPVTSHTVLDGCLIITEIGVYECRPR